MLKKNFTKIGLIVIIISCLFSSCTMYKTITVSAEDEYKKLFIGRNHNFVVSRMGAPNRETSDGAGGKILIYEQTTTYSSGSTIATANNVNYYNRTYTPGAETNTVSSQKTDFIHVFVGKDNICYNVKSNIYEYYQEVDEEETKELKKKFTVLGLTFGTPVIVSVVLWLLGVGV
ncbi:MAG: hypothetical protein J6V35_07450 [Bacteroidales bacterium]|nr:hypothetical protein [Bacteroidales bacterium]